MKNSRMPKPRESMSEDRSKEDRQQKEDGETESLPLWDVETIVVNGQPMTVTFPAEET